MTWVLVPDFGPDFNFHSNKLYLGKERCCSVIEKLIHSYCVYIFVILSFKDKGLMDDTRTVKPYLME